MPLERTRFAVNLADKPRLLFSVVEKKSGELVIAHSLGDRVSLRATWLPVLEQRYSIHESNDSPIYTTIKHTTNIQGGPPIITASLTDAIKTKSGFSIIFVRRCPDLSRDKYTIDEKKASRGYLYMLPEIDPARQTLFVGAFIGHPDSVFDALRSKIAITAHKYKKFQLVIMAQVLRMKSLTTSEIANAYTLRPEELANENHSKMMRDMMMGKPAEICIQQFEDGVANLTRLYLEGRLAVVSDEKMKKIIKERLISLPDVRGEGIGGGTIIQSDRTPTHAKPPNPK